MGYITADFMGYTTIGTNIYLSCRETAFLFWLSDDYATLYLLPLNIYTYFQTVFSVFEGFLELLFLPCGTDGFNKFLIDWGHVILQMREFKKIFVKP